MRHSRTAFGIALALGIASSAAFAAHGDRWYGTYNGDTYVRVAPTEVTRVETVEPREVIVYEERYVSPGTPLYVERDYAYREPREYYVLRDGRYVYYDPLHPQMGQLIGRGLFNRTGPNDFGQ